MAVLFTQTLGAERKICAKTLTGRNLFGSPRQRCRVTELQFYATGMLSRDGPDFE